MQTRILTAAAWLPVILIIFWFGGVLLQILVLGLSLIGMHEVYKALSGKINKLHYIGFASAIAYIATLGLHINNMLSYITAAFMLALLTALVILHRKHNISDAAVALFGFFYAAFMFSHIYLVYEYPAHGTSFTWLIFLSAWCTDTGAYFSGKSLGKHKLIPTLSPKKTVEGAVGGLIAAGIGAFFCALVMYAYFDRPFFYVWLFPVIGIVGSVFSQIGDLAASAVKRHAGIKDFGKFLPGHGGIIDRFDSVLFTAPAVYLMMRAALYFLEK